MVYSAAIRGNTRWSHAEVWKLWEKLVSGILRSVLFNEANFTEWQRNVKGRESNLQNVLSSYVYCDVNWKRLRRVLSPPAWTESLKHLTGLKTAFQSENVKLQNLVLKRSQLLFRFYTSQWGDVCCLQKKGLDFKNIWEDLIWTERSVRQRSRYRIEMCLYTKFHHNRCQKRNVCVIIVMLL